MPFRDKNRPGVWRSQVKWQGRTYRGTFQTKREAADWEVAKRKELGEQADQAPTKIAMDLLTFCNKYLDHATDRFSDKTLEEKRRLCRRLLTFCGNPTVEEVTPAMVEGFLANKKQIRSANASNVGRKNLLAMWNWGRKIQGLSGNPVAPTERLPHTPQAQYTPPTADVLKVLSVATREETVLLHAFLQTGARRSEVFRWTWLEDVNFEKRQVRLGTRKTKDGSMEYEWLPMSDELYDHLWWWWQNRPIRDSQYVFPVTSTNPGHHRGEAHTERRWFLRTLCKRAGVKRFGYHALRRYVASYLADTHKVAAKTIQRILRHKKLATTERYIQHINRDLRDTLNLLGEKGYQVGLPNNTKGVKNALNPLKSVAGATRLELATSGVTGRRSNQLNYAPADVR
jgi:integrase